MSSSMVTDPPTAPATRVPPDWRPEFVNSLRAARPWAILVAVSFVTLGLSIVAVGGGFLAFDEGLMPSGLLRVLAWSYLLFGPVIAIPALFLFRYAAAARRYAENPAPLHLIDALREHSRFWSYAAILTLVGVVIDLVLLAALLMRSPA